MPRLDYLRYSRAVYLFASYFPIYLGTQRFYFGLCAVVTDVSPVVNQSFPTQPAVGVVVDPDILAQVRLRPQSKTSPDSVK